MYSLNIVDDKINNFAKASIFWLLTKNKNLNTLKNFIIRVVNWAFEFKALFIDSFCYHFAKL